MLRGVNNGEPVETYFESVKGEYEDSANYYVSYYLGTGEGERYQHYIVLLIIFMEQKPMQ